MRAMREVQLKDRKRVKGIDVDVGLNKTINQMAIPNSVHWNRHMLSGERMTMS